MNSGQFLQCDASGCDHREDVEQLSSDMVGKPCPKCGSNLLTQADFDQFAEFSAMIAQLKSFVDAAGEPEPGTAAVRVEFGLHDGEATLKMKPVTA